MWYARVHGEKMDTRDKKVLHKIYKQLKLDTSEKENILDLESYYYYYYLIQPYSATPAP